MKKNPIGNFESIVSTYAENVDKKPIHIYYERPATWSLLPQNLSKLNILDLGCGSGWYAEQLSKAGAVITAIDISSKMVELTRKRLHGKGEFIVANLENPLDFLKDSFYDIVLAPLLIHYIEDWQSFFAEIARVLKKNGLFIFSTHQPQIQYQMFNLKNYYERALIEDYWTDIQATVRFYHHTLHELSENLYRAGFVIELLSEPAPLPELATTDPEMYKNIATKPWFLFVRALKLK